MRSKGFSLVELVLALGVLSFGLIAVLGLLPVGLCTRRETREEAQAIQNLSSLAACIQAGQPVANGNGGTFAALAPFGVGSDPSGTSISNLKWTYGGAVSRFTVYLDANGNPISSKTNAAETAFVQIIPPSDAFSVGTAYICVAWPSRTATAEYNDSSTTPTVTQKQGYVETLVYFKSL